MKDNNLNENLKKLEEISKKMDDNSLSIEESLKLFEMGIKLYRQSIQELNNVKEKVSILIDNQVKDFDTQGENGE